LEFTLPPGELDRIFVEFKAPAPWVPVVDDTPTLVDQPEELVHPPRPRPPPVQFLPDLDHGMEPTGEIDPDESKAVLQRPRPVAWLCAAAAAALLLIAQVLHHNREWFSAHAPGSGGSAIRALYQAMGAPLPAPSNLAAYQLRQWGVTGDPNANGILRLRASILNTAAQLQPYPLLRVTLADRFGRTIGRRDFEPAEYLGTPIAKLLAPGERADATLAILDPGKNAEGFEIDVCLRGVDRTISCANDAAAQSKR
jgi:hypothetical protein